MLTDSIESLPTVILPADDDHHGDWTDAGADAAAAAEDSHQGDDDDDFGMLIVPGEEEEEEGTTANSTQQRPIRNDNYLYDETAMNLSLPGTDSLPSDLGSLGDDDVDQDLHEPPQQQQQRNDPAPNLRTRVALSLRRLSPSFIMIVVTGVFLLISLAGNFYQFRQRSKARTTLLQLEQKVAKLQQELQLQKQRRPTFTWEEPPNSARNNNNKCNDQTTLVDNCWLQAKANVQLGDCASQAKRKVKKKLKKWKSSLWRAGEHVWSEFGGNNEKQTTTKNSTTGADNLIRAHKEVKKKLSSWGRSLWHAGEHVWDKVEEIGTSIIMYEDDDSNPVGNSTSVATYHRNNNNNNKKKKKHLKKGVRDAAGMLASSVAYASLAAIITDAAGLNQMVEQARDALQDANWVHGAAHPKEE